MLAFEWHYEGIKQKCICEELIKTQDGSLPIDYKYFCCNGKISCILVCTDRDETCFESYHYYFDRDWKRLDYAIGDVVETPPRIIERPNNLEHMNDIAERLAAVFPFVRVDLYNVEGKVYFGELTFTPVGGQERKVSSKLRGRRSLMLWTM